MTHDPALKENLFENKSHAPREIPPLGEMPRVIPLSLVWHLILSVVLVALSGYIFFGLDTFYNLGDPVRYFAGVVVLLPVVVGLTGSVLMLRRRKLGRYMVMGLDFLGFVLTLFALAGVWGLFASFEHIVDAIMQYTPVTLGFALAYAIVWVTSRLNLSPERESTIQQIAAGIAMLTLVALLLLADVLGAANYVLSTYASPVTWGLTITTICFGAVSWYTLQLGQYFNETPDERTSWQGWLMLSPNIVGFILFFAGPLLLSFYLSFTDSSVGQIPNIIGLENYGRLLALEFEWQSVIQGNAQDILSFGYTELMSITLGDGRLVIGAQDALFWVSLRNTLVFCLLLLPLSIVPAIILSLILNSKLPGMKFFRAIYFLPSVAAVVGTALIWRWLYNSNSGYINYAIAEVVQGINNLLGTGIEQPTVDWLSDPNVVLFSIVILAAWRLIGYNTVLFLAGLQGIPDVLYEAAEIDGANRWQQFWNVTLPMLAPTTFFVTITTMVQGLQVFNEPYTLFPSQPIPTNATTSVYYLYRQGFQQFDFGYASAVAWFLFAIIFALTLIQFRVNRQDAYDA